MNKPTVENIQSIIETVIDPELGIDIFTMGLIYDILITEDHCVITMTYTTPLCPHGETMKNEMKEAIHQEFPTLECEINLTFEPKWQPTDELRSLLGV